MPFSWIEVGALLLVALTALVTLLAVFLVWRNGYARGWFSARREPPRCVSCGYNLSGLSHCRCPECGREHNLDELWRQPRYVPPGPFGKGRRNEALEDGQETP